MGLFGKVRADNRTDNSTPGGFSVGPFSTSSFLYRRCNSWAHRLLRCNSTREEHPTHGNITGSRRVQPVNRGIDRDKRLRQPTANRAGSPATDRRLDQRLCLTQCDLIPNALCQFKCQRGLHENKHSTTHPRRCADLCAIHNPNGIRMLHSVRAEMVEQRSHRRAWVRVDSIG
jgi:hypothetical protein